MIKCDRAACRRQSHLLKTLPVSEQDAITFLVVTDCLCESAIAIKRIISHAGRSRAAGAKNILHRPAIELLQFQCDCSQNRC